MEFNHLSTQDTHLDKIPLQEYPRPQLRRDSYLCLNGEWKLEISNSDNIPNNYNQKIIVPFCVESDLSSCNKKIDKSSYLYYSLDFNLPKKFISDKVIIHFDGIDQIGEIYLNNKLVDKTFNGYIPHEFDITPYLSSKNKLVVKCKDELNHLYPWGKQKNNRGGMWYTPVSGIWKSVWLESVKNNYVTDLKITPSLDKVKIEINHLPGTKKIKLTINNRKKTFEFKNDSIEILIQNPHHWTIDDPYLYEFELITEEDHIYSYFALREVGIKTVNEHPYFTLNNKPIFLHGVLDQGYFPDGIYTPRSYDEYALDIKRLKKLGFNLIRKHIKVEPLYFYYLCDKIGILVLQDMVNNGDYHFFRDTVLPTIGFQKLPNCLLKKSKNEQIVFEESMKDTISLLYNSPSIIGYTIFNEGWGQKNAKELYLLGKKLDSTRLFDTTSGWFSSSYSDFTSLHVYFKPIKIRPSSKPILISEFGGYVYKDKNNSFNLSKTYGYKIFKDIESFQKGLISLYDKQVIPQIEKGIMGTILTQITDVEDETNGLFTYNRKVCKVNEKEMKELAKRLVIKDPK